MTNAVTPAMAAGGSRKLILVGRILAVPIVLLFAMSAVMKFRGGPEMEEGLKHSGLPASMVFPLAVVELTCVVLYAIPATSVLGAILLTGYLGGAICTHWRIGEPFYIQAGLGVLVWLSLVLREPRLRVLAPLRTPRDAN